MPLLQARPRLLLAITVAVFGVGGAFVGYQMNQPTASAIWPGVSPPPDVQDGVRSVFGDDQCVGAETAAAEVRAMLDTLGRSEWTIVRGAGAEGATCVGASIDSEARQVVLLMALSPAVREGIDGVAEQLLQECRSRDEAVQLVESVAGVSGDEAWEVRTDGSQSYGPAGRIDEINRHVEQGCWIYAGTGWTAEGLRVYWVGGK
jgi:hypothetical protein